MTIRALFVFVACAASGCVAEAPKEIDALLHYFWDEFESSPAVIDGAVTNLHAALGGDDLANRKDGELKDLEQAEIADLPVTRIGAPNASDASGFFMGRKFTCDFPQLEKISYWLDQKSLYSDDYEKYSRVHTSSLDAYLQRQTDTLTWDSMYTTKISTATFEAKNTNSMRYLPGPSGLGPVLLRRSWLPEAAGASGGSFGQDYQLEIYYRRGDGAIVHAYGVWRDMTVGGITDDQDFFASVMIDQMDKWDSKTETLCKEGRP